MAFRGEDELAGETPKTVLTLSNLPAGSYAIFAKTGAFTGGKTKLIGCSLEIGGAAGSGTPTDSSISIVGGSNSAPVLVLHTFSSPGGNAQLSCFESLGEPTEHIEMITPRITAIQVQSQTSVAG